MGSCISAIGIANPENKIPQQAIYHFMVNAFGLNSTNAARLKSIYDHSGIDYRYSVVPDFGKADVGDYTFFEQTADLEPFPTTERRLKLYGKHATAIAVKAVQNCIAGLPADILQQVTHLITISCTGMQAPGIDIELVEQLNLRRDTERTCINFMGCYGAINGLKTADYICRAEPNAKVLVVSVELCTLHFQKGNTLDNWVANSLFSDGAAAVLVENELNHTGNAPYIKLQNFYSEFISEARDDMGWYIGNTGFQMRLTSRVSKQIKTHIKALTGRLTTKAGISFNEIDAFAVHPGGRKILEAVEDALELSENANYHAYETLREYGNMSSATILFVLHKMLQAPGMGNKKVLSFAFGPGLTVEGMVLQTSQA